MSGNGIDQRYNGSFHACDDLMFYGSVPKQGCFDALITNAEPLLTGSGSLFACNDALLPVFGLLQAVFMVVPGCNEAGSACNVPVTGCNETLQPDIGSLQRCNDSLQPGYDSLFGCNGALRAVI